MAFEIRAHPEWSWSQSRDHIFKECKRKYYYHYYASHNGWLHDSDNTAKQAYRLKQIQNLYLILGESIHDAAEKTIKQWQARRQLPTSDEMIRLVRHCLNQAYRDSHNQAKWKNTPKKVKMLHELYYGDQLPENKVQKIKQRMKSNIEALFQSDSLRQITQNQIRIIELEKLNTFSINDQDSKIYVKLDLLYQTNTDHWVIADWKTGWETDQIEHQMMLYALYLHERYHVPYDQIHIHVEYLSDGTKKEYVPTETIIEQTKAGIIESITAMKKLLKDETLNQPLSPSAFPAEPEKGICAQCNFREMCTEKI